MGIMVGFAAPVAAGRGRRRSSPPPHAGYADPPDRGWRPLPLMPGLPGEIGEGRFRRAAHPDQTGAGVRAQHRRDGRGRQEVAVEARDQQAPQFLCPVRIPGVHHLGAQAGALAELLGQHTSVNVRSARLNVRACPRW